MSLVTGVVIITTDDDEVAPFAALNKWLKDHPCGPSPFLDGLAETAQHSGGHKHPEMGIWSGGLNYLAIDEFIAEVKRQTWADDIILIIRRPNDIPRVIDLATWEPETGEAEEARDLPEDGDLVRYGTKDIRGVVLTVGLPRVVD